MAVVIVCRVRFCEMVGGRECVRKREREREKRERGRMVVCSCQVDVDECGCGTGAADHITLARSPTRQAKLKDQKHASETAFHADHWLTT
jgi:hypothetical protein